MQELSDKVKTIDCLAQRWARETRNPTGSLDYGPSTIAILMAMKDGAVLKGRAAPMPDDVLLFDQVLAHRSTPPRVRLVIVGWYCGYEDEAVVAKARRTGIPRTTLRRRWIDALEYMACAMTLASVNAA